MELTQAEARELSRLLFDAREQIAMWGDVATVFGKRDPDVDSVRDRLDAYRTRYGWSLDGYGAETAISR